MGKITFIEHDNTEHVTEFEAGQTLSSSDVEGLTVVVDGGGECACGTCHMIIADEWFGKTGSIGDAEEQMLSMTPERAKTSRLGCQVKTTDAMDGLTVHLPEFQM